MKKIFLFFIFLLFTTLFFSGTVNAQFSQCGDANAEGAEKRCCTAAARTVDINPSEKKAFDFGCFNLLFFNFCPFAESQKSDQLVRDLTPLNAIKDIDIGLACSNGTPSTKDVTDENCICNKKSEATLSANIVFCNRYLLRDTKAANYNKPDYDKCFRCFTDNGFWTGLGCFYVKDWKTFFERNVFGLLMGLAGIFAFFCIIYSAFLMQTSSGNPEKVKNAQAMLVSCITGLMLIIFSVIVLKIIGVDILRIPGFQ